MGRTLKKLNTRIGALVMAVLLLVPVLPAVHAAPTGGACGDGVRWELTGSVLTVSGRGTMADYEEIAPAPWASYAPSIRCVVVEQGVQNVGNFAFFKLEKLESVQLAKSVKKVGNWAFYGCTALETLDLGKGVTEIGESAFERCLSLRSVRLPGTVQVLRRQAFYRCESLLSIVIPASVVKMEESVFAYCIAMRTAAVLANIAQLPFWTFYGCYALQEVSITSAITEIGTQAFHNCDNLSKAVYGGNPNRLSGQLPGVNQLVGNTQPNPDAPIKVDTTATQKNPDGTTTSVNHSYQVNQNSSIDTQTTQSGIVIDAVLENQDGWDDVFDQINSATEKASRVETNVYLKGDAEVSGADLNRLVGKDVTLTIHTGQGAQWRINGKNLSATGLAKSYSLSFTLKELTKLNKKQSAAVGKARAFVVIFHDNINFNVEVELPLGETLARQTAVFFDPGKDGYTRAQAVMVDKMGVAHFYLSKVAARAEYLIGINVPNAGGVNDTIIPDTMKSEYPKVEQVEDVKYVITGAKSSLGINIVQLTWIIVAVLVGSFVIVGAVLFVLNKKKLKNGYIPVWDDEETK